MLLLALLLSANVDSARMAALIGNDRVTASYPGFRRMQGDTTALAANGKTRDGMTDSVIIRKVAVLSPAAASEFTLRTAQRIALTSPHTASFVDELSRTVLLEQKTTACKRPAYGLVVKRKMRMHTVDGTQDWVQADTYVLELVGRDVWQATYERTYAADIESSMQSLIRFTGNFCVERNYRR